MTATDTRRKIVHAAETLYYRHGVRAVSVDAIAVKAGVTKKTIYYHFRSKDDIAAAYLAARDQPNLLALRRWFESGGESLARKLTGLFGGLAGVARNPRWRGCSFLRTAYELASMPGHPAFRTGAAHKKSFEKWLASCLEAEGCELPEESARQISVLIDGAFSAAMIHRDPSYFESAGRAARTLIARGNIKLPTGPAAGRARSSAAPPE